VKGAGGKRAYDHWPTTGVAGELSQELPAPEHFEQAARHLEPSPPR
jgi:hypothetical protein